MGLTVRPMEILESSEFNSSNRSLYDYVNLNQSNASIYTNGTEQSEVATHSPSDHPTMIDCETDQSMSPQTMRTASDQSLVQASNGRILENCHQVFNTAVTIARPFANRLKCCNPADGSDDRECVPKILSSRSDRQLTGARDPLLSYTPQFSAGSDYPAFSTDNVFQEQPDSEVSPINRLTAETKRYEYSAPGDREIRPSTTSTEFSLSGSPVDTASQADDLCEADLNGKKFAEGGRITLADYLDSLDGSSGGSSKLLKSIPHLTPVRRLPSLTGPVSSEPSLSPNPVERITPDQQHTDQANQTGTDLSPNKTGEPINGTPSEAMLMTNESMTSENALSNTNSPSGPTAPKSGSAPPEYLIKRRFFLLERLVERYEELLKLMNEELELTGRPPKHYLECMNAHKAATAALNKLTPPRTQILESSESGKHEVDKKSRDSRRAPGAQLPPATELRATNRLQETRFVLSPRTVRRVGVKLSPSANNLLLSSQVSLCPGDTQSMGEPDLSKRRTASLADQCPLHCSLHDRAKIGTIKPDSSRRRYPIISWNRRRQLGSSRGLTNFRNLADDTTRVHSIDHSTPLSISLSDLTCRCTNGFVQFASPSGLAPDPETDDLGSTDQRRASIVSLGCGSVDQSENTDRAEALAWIEMELEAVRKILEANRKCAAEPGRKRESRKAYQLVCQKNEQTIAQLERQKVLLLQQPRSHGDSDKSSIGCISRGGTDSLTSGTDPVDYDPGVVVTGSEYCSEEPASATGNSRSGKGIPSVRSRLHRSSPNPTTNMVDGLNILTSEGSTAASRTARSGPSHNDGDRAVTSFSSVNRQEVPLSSSSRSQVNLISKNSSQPSFQPSEASQESSPTICVINQVVPVHHERVISKVNGACEQALLPAKPLAICAANGELTPRRELSSDTGLGVSLLHTSHTESGSDLSRWSGHSIGTTRSISSGDTPGNAAIISHQRVPPDSKLLGSHYPAANPTQVQVSTDQTNKVIRLVPQENTENSSNLFSKPSVRTHSPYVSRVGAVPRITVQPALNHVPPGSYSKYPMEVEVHCSHLPITTVYGHKVIREYLRSSATQRTHTPVLISVDHTDRPRMLESLPATGENGAQKTHAACYSILPKFSGTVSAACSFRPGSRSLYPASYALRQPRRNQSESDCQLSFDPISTSSRVQSVQPKYESVQTITTKSTNAHRDGRVLVHSRSGDLISYQGNRHVPRTMIRSSSGILHPSSQWLVHPEPESSRPF